MQSITDKKSKLIGNWSNTWIVIPCSKVQFIDLLMFILWTLLPIKGKSKFNCLNTKTKSFFPNGNSSRSDYWLRGIWVTVTEYILKWRIFCCISLSTCFKGTYFSANTFYSLINLFSAMPYSLYTCFSSWVYFLI